MKVLSTKIRMALAAFGALALAGGGAVMLSAQALPPVETDPAAIAAALKACDAGDAEKCYVYGRAVAAKSTTQEDIIAAYKYIQKACDGGVANACFGTSRRHAMGFGVKIDLKKARDYAARGCKGGDERACAVQKRFDRPAPSAASLIGLPYAAQANVNNALYIEPDGAVTIANYADADMFKDNPKMKWNMKATSCEMGHWEACQDAALAFTDTQGFEGEGKKDLPRAIKLAQIGCDGGDSVSCHILGLVVSVSNGNIVTERSQAAYRKAYPEFQALCESGKGYYCDAIAHYHDGIAFDYNGERVEYYYAKGCELGYQKACEGYAKALDKRQQFAAQDAAKRQQQAREDMYMLYMWGSAPKDTATINQCLGYRDKFNNEINDYNRRGEALVQGTDSWNVSSKRSKLADYSEDSCTKLLNIADQAGRAGCYGEDYRYMMEQIPKFENVSVDGPCYHRSLEMGADWNPNNDY